MNALIKRFIPMNLLLRIKYFSAFREKRSLPTLKGPCIFYLDAPDYGNLGDQAIALAIRQFAQREFPDYIFIEILQKDLPAYSRWLKKNIRQEDMIFLTGGGNMGNVYRIYEAARRYVIEHFPNNKIIIFPQTIQYTQDVFGQASLKKSASIYNRHNDLLICAREEFSYEQMCHWYYDSKVVLCPDIVFSLSHSVKKCESSKIGVCLRDDLEKMISLEDEERLLADLKKVGSIQYISTTGKEEFYDQHNRCAAVVGKLKEIASCKVLVTDRLHAAIFAVITNTPCVVLPNNNGKIIGTMKWLADSDRIILLDSSLNVIKAIETVQTGIKSGNPSHSALLHAIME